MLWALCWRRRGQPRRLLRCCSAPSRYCRTPASKSTCASPPWLVIWRFLECSCMGAVSPSRIACLHEIMGILTKLLTCVFMPLLSAYPAQTRVFACIMGA